MNTPTADTRDSYLPNLLNLISIHIQSNGILDHQPPPRIFTQFLLDCSSLNLPEDIRIPLRGGVTKKKGKIWDNVPIRVDLKCI